MYSSAFDAVLLVVLAVCAVALLSGRGDFILNSFRNKADKDKPLSYDKKKLSISCGIFCVVLFCADIVIMIFERRGSVVPIYIAIGVIIISLVVLLWYLKKYAKVEVKQEKSISKKIKDLKR